MINFPKLQCSYFISSLKMSSKLYYWFVGNVMKTPKTLEIEKRITQEEYVLIKEDLSAMEAEKKEGHNG